jgi:8-oxo-dGTP diphosphatase
MTGGDFLNHNEWFARQPGVVLAAGALITDPAGRVLLVKPNYRDYWTVPGGICEHGEPPHAGCAREVAEEIGLELLVGRLLAIDWAQPYGPEARPIMHFLFDCEGLDDGASIVLQSEELDDFRFTDPAEVSEYLAPYGVRRVTAALEGRASGAAVYQPTRVT